MDMAKRSKIPEEKRPANLTREEMRSAIPKLKRRIDDLKNFKGDYMSSSAGIDALRDKIDDTLIEIFGPDTIEYDRYSIGSLYNGPLRIGGVPDYERKKGYEDGLVNAIVKLTSLIETLEEKIEEAPEEPSVRAQRTFRESNIHPELIKGIGKLFEDGHYANAVEDACKILEMFVQMRSMRTDLSGTELMQKVFSPKNPILKFNELKTETDVSEQQGMMFLYAGAMSAFRNPRAHSIRVDDPENALDILLFISLLLKSLDNTTRA
jgi:uncharacterized protein (TIGR02391 family)